MARTARFHGGIVRIRPGAEEGQDLYERIDCHGERCNILFSGVGYAESFHGGFGSGSYGGHLYLVCAVCDVTI